VNAVVQLIGGTVDSVTAQVVATLRRNPIARIAMLLYVVFVHLFIYVLLGRLQHHAAISHEHQSGTATGTLSRFDTPINKIQHQ
jgi:membrane protein YdbS with pleckstrin-like domain